MARRGSGRASIWFDSGCWGLNCGAAERQRAHRFTKEHPRRQRLSLEHFPVGLTAPPRHGGAHPGHPRLGSGSALKTWMPGIKPGMTGLLRRCPLSDRETRPQKSSGMIRTRAPRFRAGAFGARTMRQSARANSAMSEESCEGRGATSLSPSTDQCDTALM
jgi:hypothetical protein